MALDPRVRQPHRPQRERIDDRDFIQPVEPPRRAAVAGAHVGAQQHRAAAAHGRAQARDPFRRLPIGDARIGQAAHRQDRRIVLGREIVVGRVGQDGAKILFALDRVAPFRPFRRRQRQRVVEHRVEHVDERHLGDDAGEQFAGAVGDRAHQHAAGAAAMADDAFCAGVFRLDQRASGRGEIIERVRLLLALAVEIPAPALVGAAADMRDRIDEAAIDQRQPVGGKRRRHRHAVGAVAVEQQRRACRRAPDPCGAGSRPAPARRHARSP